MLTTSSSLCSKPVLLTGGTSITTTSAAAISCRGASVLAKTCSSRYVPVRLLLILSAAGAARRVDIHATLHEGGKASAFPLPPSASHRRASGAETGAGDLGPCCAVYTVLGRFGAWRGGSGIFGLAAASAFPLPLLLAPVLERRVSVWGAVPLAPSAENSLHGRTMWPEGATSNWKASVPGGRSFSIAISPGPQK